MIKYYNEIPILQDSFPTIDHYNTERYNLSEIVSIGIKNEANIEDELIDFQHNLVSKFTQLEHYNLFACQYLNLRGSSFNHLIPSNLYSLIYADISFTKIS